MADAVNQAPGVSYVIPVLNEAGYAERAVRSVLEQDYDGPREVVLALGPSTDGTTEALQALAAGDDRIRLVENPDADIPVGLNLAIRASRYPVIVRVDAHSELESDYTAKAIATLERTGAANVGGVMLARGKTSFQRAVARAYNSPFGLGGARYHGSVEEGPAESAYLGVFRREVLEAVGLFDESIRRGEDWELNLRIRAAGHRVWFDPALHVSYWPRERPDKLARQFFATGAWRAELVRRYGGRNPWRFFVPPLLVLTVLASIVVGVLQLMGLVSGVWSLLACIVHLGPLLYLLLVAVVSALIREVSPARERWLFLIVFPIMHLAWGTGFLFGMLTGAGSVNDTSRTAI